VSVSHVYLRAVAEISRKRLVSNVRELFRHSPKGHVLFPVLKANAYGHDASIVASVLQDAFSPKKIPYVCVARFPEAIDLIECGWRRKILVLSDDNYELISNLSRSQKSAIVPVISSLESFKDFENYAKYFSEFHLDFNTGMNRLGIGWNVRQAILDRLKERVLKLESRGIFLSGIMSHLAFGEESHHPFNAIQVKRFIESVRKWGPGPDVLFHLNNSGGHAQGLLHNFCDASRVGIHLYGAHADLGMKKKLNLYPVMKVLAPLKQLRLIPAREGVGYNHTYKTSEPSLVGVFEMGYADGFLRHFPKANVGLSVLGEIMPVVGRVSMDLVNLDLTKHSQAKKWVRLMFENKKPKISCEFLGDEVTAESVAKKLGTISYEIFCGIGPRVQRVLKK
jgi:alanine racemase